MANAKKGTQDNETYRKAPKSAYSAGRNEARRHWIVAILMQISIRIRYIFESWLGIQPELAAPTERLVH